MKIQRKGRCFDTTEDIQRESNNVLDALLKRTSRKNSSSDRKAGSTVLSYKGNISKVKGSKRREIKHFLEIRASLEEFPCHRCILLLIGQIVGSLMNTLKKQASPASHVEKDDRSNA